MSTRSTISIKLNTGTSTPVFLTIYCHWDGYPSHNGKILRENYNKIERILKLIKGGDLSALRENIEPENGLPHTFDNPQKDVCIYYIRDRNDNDCEAKVSFSEQEHLKLLGDYWSEYDYLFADGRWLFKENHNKFWKCLTLQDCEIDL